MAIQDTDIFVVQRGEQAYKMPATQLNDYVDGGGGEPGPSTDTLTDVCNRGSSPATCNRNMQVNGTLTASSTVQGGYVVSTGDVKANSSLVSANDVAISRNFYNKWNKGDSTAAIYEDGSAHFARRSGSNGAFLIAVDGRIEHRASIKTRGLEIVPYAQGSETGGESLLKCVWAYTQIGGATRRNASINQDGYLTAGDATIFIRSTATNTQSIDTSRFIAALKAINLHKADIPVPEEQRSILPDPEATHQTEIGFFLDDVEATDASSFLLDEDRAGKFLNDRTLTNFLFGVCKEQQTLIENLTARVAALEADHTAAMSNMGDSSY